MSPFHIGMIFGCVIGIVGTLIAIGIILLAKIEKAERKRNSIRHRF